MLVEVEVSWSSRPMAQPWFSLLMALVSMILLGLCIYDRIEKMNFAKTAVRVSGTVVELRSGNTTSRAVISFNDQHGREHRFISKVSSSRPAFQEGESVQVLFPPDLPNYARIDSFLEAWFFSLITGSIGIALGLGSIFAWVFRKRLFPQYANLCSNS